MPPADLDATFRQLREILLPYGPSLVCVHDTAAHHYLDTAHVQKNGSPLFFGAVKQGKQHVSFHLMPVYLHPELLDGISDELRRRMQGKSCFNFKRAEPALLEELARLTRAGYERYRAAGYVT